MTNSNLVAVFNGTIANQVIQLCNARELHQYLESKRQYGDWIKDRITDYGFIENEDYIIVTERTNGRPRKEYHITLDMGKELGMVERNEKGRQIRRHFIACQKRLKELPNPQLNLPLAEVEADEEALHIIVNLYHSLREAHEFSVLAHDVDHRWLKQQIDKELGGHLLHNLNYPAKNALDKAKKYIHAKSERIMFVKGMLSLLEETQPKRIDNFN